LQDDQEEFEIDLNDDEPEFLKGHSSRSGIEMSPIKIVKNPEGSMQRAAMTAVSVLALPQLHRLLAYSIHSSCSTPGTSLTAMRFLSPELAPCCISAGFEMSVFGL
jgi:hypothetical protein